MSEFYQWFFGGGTPLNPYYPSPWFWLLVTVAVGAVGRAIWSVIRGRRD